MSEKTILLVDDNRESLNSLDQLIKSFGFGKTIKADSGDSAWVMLRYTKVDCVLCSLNMDEMSGIALLKIFRRDDDFSSTPFFLYNENFTKVKVIKAGQIGVTGLFVVPFEAELLQNKINSAMDIVQEPVILKTKKIFEEGLELIENQEYEKALEIFTSLVTQKENPEYYFNIGFIKTSQTKYIEAIEAFGMAAKLDRFFARAYEEIGKVYKLIGDLKKAEEYMQQAAEIYLDTDKIGTAESILNEILDSGSDSMNVFNTLGVLYRKKGESETALKHYKKALKVHPDESYIYYNIGRLYMDMKDTEKAVEYFNLSLEKDPEFEDSKQVIKAIELGII